MMIMSVLAWSIVGNDGDEEKCDTGRMTELEMSCSIQIIIIDFGVSRVLGFREALGDPRFDED